MVLKLIFKFLNIDSLVVLESFGYVFYFCFFSLLCIVIKRKCLLDENMFNYIGII